MHFCHFAISTWRKNQRLTEPHLMRVTATQPNTTQLQLFLLVQLQPFNVYKGIKP